MRITSHYNDTSRVVIVSGTFRSGEMATPNEKLEAARMRKRWSVAVASERVGVSVNTFNRWERGLQLPQLGTLDQLCRAFGLSPEELGFGDAVMIKRRTPSACQKEMNTEVPCQLTVSSVCLTVDLPPQGQVHLQPIQQAQITIEQIQRSLDSMSQQQHAKGDDKEGKGVSRRQVITTLIGTPAAVFGMAQGMNTTLLRPEEVLALCAVHIPFAWRLYFEGGLADVEELLPGYLSQLLPLTQQSSPYTKRAANLLSQGYQLASLAALQHQNFGTAYTYAKQAFDYGEQAEIRALQTASLIRQAQVYLYLNHPVPRLQVYQQAAQLAVGTSPLLQSRVYAGLTETHAKLGNSYEARQFLELAHDTFPTRYELDPNFAYTHFNQWSITALEGLMFLNLNQPKQAWDAFAEIDQRIAPALIPNRVELHVRQAATSIALEDKEQSFACLQLAAKSATAVKNQLRYNEAYTLYNQMRAKWSDDHAVKSLQQLFA